MDKEGLKTEGKEREVEREREKGIVKREIESEGEERKKKERGNVC